jgi:cephalosporin hydroxylase/glycosyltransferase involved in cell wall biosynthesis
MGGLTDREPAIVEGRVDHCDHLRASGWAWFPDTPARVARVQVVVDDAVVASGEAQGYRPDLGLSGKRGGFCQFEIVFAVSLPRDRTLAVHIRVDDGQDLVGSPLVLQTPAERRRNQPGPDDGPSGSAQPLGGDAGVLGYLERFGPETVSGWAYDPAGTEVLSLSVHSDGAPILTVAASGWREHAEELRQGDGRCAFEFPVPKALRDGALHDLDIRLAGTDRSVLSRPLRVRFAALGGDESAPPGPLKRLRRALGAHYRRQKSRLAPVEFSIIVNFYNMRREAERTLTALRRDYQRDIGDLGYEVLCVDNGSNPPLDEAWIRSFGPEFRLVRPDRPHPAPGRAINAAARQARGRYLAIMIDGAHVLTPGVLAETRAAIRDHPGTLVALRYWFVGGDQRWLAAAGYQRATEDILFSKIGWPSDGYRLFEIGAPSEEKPNPWFNPLPETNCLFLPRALYRRIGGVDEAFTEPGGGFSNMDLMRRAADANGESFTCLVGEASFHQFHGGTTTNVDRTKEGRLFRAYYNAHRALRGKPYRHMRPEQIRLRGRIRSSAAVSAGLRPSFMTGLGVTDALRPGAIERQIDSGAQTYLTSVYAECGVHRTTTWLGTPVALAPADLVAIQEILSRVRPTRIVVAAREVGLLIFLDGVLTLLGLEQAKIICVTESRMTGALPDRVVSVVGAACAAETLAQVDRLLEAEESNLVLLEPSAGDPVPVAAIAAYSRLVAFRCYLIVLRTAAGQPWIGYSKYWPLQAIHKFLDGGAPFVIDRRWERHLISACPSGYLQRTKDIPRTEDYDATLDDLQSL